MGILEKISAIFKGDTTDYQALIAQGAIIVDVRSPLEFNHGHARGSKNIPLDKIKHKVKKLKGKEVILVCRSGARAGSAKAILERNGITAYNAGNWANVN